MAEGVTERPKEERGASEPVEKFVPVHEVAFVEFQLRIVGVPLATVVGFAAMLSVGEPPQGTALPPRRSRGGDDGSP